MKKIYFLLLSLLTFSAFAQNYEYTIYDTSNSGILSNYVGDIKMDANGMLWISSYSGVSTFNGTTFTNYTVNNSGIASNAIKKIEIDGLNRKWMASENNGIIRYSGTTWTNYTTSNSGLPNNVINDIAVDGLNNLWVATSSGLTKFNGTTWTTYASLTNINSLATDSNNGVWVTNNNMMYKFNGTDFNLIDQGTYKILHIENNTIYGTTGDGFLTYSTAGTFLNMQYPTNSCLSGYQYNDVDVDSANKVWVAFQGDGLQNFTNCNSYTTGNSGLPDNYISTVRTGTSGIVWAGTLQLGLVKMTPIASTCNSPSQFWSQNITSTTASLNWAAAVPAPNSYVIRYNTTNVIGGIQDTTVSTSLALSNLTPNTDYHWWIASVCGEQQSSWVYGGFFYTPQVTASCNAPTNTIIYNLGATSCLIGWTAPAPAPSSGYEVYLATSSVAPGVNTTPTYTSTSTSVNIPSGLSPSTSYYCWVRSNCGGAKSAWSPVVNFVTNTISGCNQAYYGQWPTGTYTPACSGSIEQININAWAGEYNNVNILANRQYTFSTSVSTDFITITNDLNVVLVSGPSPLSWASQTYSGVIRYYLHTDSNCGIQNTDRVRYIQCAAAASCGLPTALAVSNITSNSCRLTWNAPTPAASSYDIYVSTTNAAPIATTTATQTSNGNIVGALNNLASSTTYYYWVRSNCNGTKSAWVSGGSFTTIAALICNGAIYGLYPETTFTPTCSTSIEQIATDAWAGEYSNVNVNANHQYTFSSSVATDFITIINASGTSVLASGTSPLVWNSTTSGVIRYHLNTNANCGFQNSIRVKSIQCTATSSCGLPFNLAVSNITSNSCRLFWSPPTLTTPNSYDIYVSTTTTAPIATTPATQTSNSSAVVTLSGLSASTTYYYWVRSNCNGIKSAWVSGGSFTTILALNCNGATYGLYPATTYTPACTGSTEQIITNAWAGEYTNVNIVANKQYTFTSSIVSDYITITNTTGTMVLASGLTPLSWNSNNTSGLIRYYLHANANCGAQDASRIRSIKCESVSSCNPPTQFGSEVLSSTTAVIGWIPSTSAPNGGYFYAYNTNPIIGVGGIYGSTFSTNADLNNLTPNTTYYWWVSSNCATSQSDWAYGGSFTTPSGAASCNAPTQFWSDGVTSTTATLGWIPSTSAPNGGYLYVYNTSPTIGGFDGSTFSTSANLTDLLPNTTYYWWVAADCVTSQSEWALGGSFTTLPGTSSCNAPTQFWSENVTATSAKINWIPSTSAPNGGYLYVYNTNPTIGGIDGSSSSTMANLTDLLPNTTYYWWVASNCVTSQSEWALGGSFTTPAVATGCWQKIAAGNDHTVAIQSDGTLWTWGINDVGQLGDGTTVNRNSPVQIGTGANWQSIATVGNHTVAIKTDGTLWAWGWNIFGQLGDGTNTNRLVPTQIGTASNWRTVATGNVHTFAIKTNGTLWAWGSNGGRLGDGTNSAKNVPTQVGTATNWVKISGGVDNSLAIKSDGTLWGTGVNFNGELGDGTTISKNTFTQIGTATDWLQIVANGNSTHAIKTNGTLWAWGYNFYGQLGDGTISTRLSPVQIGTDSNWQKVDNSSATIAVKSNGTLWSWGENTYGNLGDGTAIQKSSPVQVGFATDWQDVYTSGRHSVGLKTDGSLSVWGLNANGQIGNGTTTNSLTPLAINCPVSLNVDDFSSANNIKVYPNPVNDILNISFEQEINTLSVFNMLGQEVLAKSLHSNEGTLDFSNLASGTYLVKVKAGNALKIVKIIKL